jgi:hypothetical protein
MRAQTILIVVHAQRKPLLAKPMLRLTERRRDNPRSTQLLRQRESLRL